MISLAALIPVVRSLLCRCLLSAVEAMLRSIHDTAGAAVRLYVELGSLVMVLVQAAGSVTCPAVGQIYATAAALARIGLLAGRLAFEAFRVQVNFDSCWCGSLTLDQALPEVTRFA